MTFLKIALAAVVIFVVFNVVRGNEEPRQPPGATRTSTSNEYRLPKPISASAYTEIDGKPHLLLMSKRDNVRVETADLRIISVAPGEDMEQRGWIHTSMSIQTPPSAIAVANEHVYVAMTREGEERPALWVVDISNPRRPFEANLLRAEMPIYDLVASADGYMIASGFDDQFLVYDISVPNEPELVASFTEPVAAAPKLQLIDSTLVVDHMAGVKFLDVTSIEQPELLVEINHPDYQSPEFLPAPGAFLDGTEGLSRNVPDNAYLDVALADGMVAIAAGQDGLNLIDVDELSGQEAPGVFAPGGHVVSLGIEDGYVYSLSAEPIERTRVRFTPRTIDVSDIDAPRVIDDSQTLTGLPRYQEVVAKNGNVWILFNDAIIRYRSPEQ
jgi:hypothetical protein